MIGPIVLQVVLIGLNAIFASAEIAVISMNAIYLKQLAQDGDVRAKRLMRLTEQPARFLATIQVAITLAGLLGSAYAADSFSDPLADVLIHMGIPVPEHVLSSVAVFLITLILAYFSLVFGELVPKRIAMKRSEQLALSLARMLYGVSKLFAPLVWLLTVSTNGVLRLFGINPQEQEESVSKEEICMLLNQGREQGVMEAEETEIIRNVLDWDDMTVEQLCTHRIDTVILDMEDDMQVWEQTIYEHRHTYYPICEDNTDNVTEVLDTRDYFRMTEKSREAVLQQAVDEPYFIPDGMKANVLFRQMKDTRRYFAVVIDEYGGFAGIITLHDLMEALVGDLDDVEEPEAQPEIQQLSEAEWRIWGSADLQNVADLLKLPLPVDMYDTYGGFVCGVIGRVPADGERLCCESHGMRICVEEVEHHRIVCTTVTFVQEASQGCA